MRVAVSETRLPAGFQFEDLGRKDAPCRPCGTSGIAGYHKDGTVALCTACRGAGFGGKEVEPE